MDTQKVNLAVIIKNPSIDDEFLLTKQNPPPKFNDPQYDCYQDSDLWDLPSAQLSPLDSPRSSCRVQIEAEDNSFLELSRKFDLDSAVRQVLGQVGLGKTVEVKWNFWKVVEEPEFGPGNPVKTLYIVGKLENFDGNLEDCGKWMSTKGCADLLIEVKHHNYRIGPLVVVGLLNDSMGIANLNIPPTLRSQLEQIITALPRKLVVFVTHHHHDHVDGLAIVQKCNPDAILLAHSNTFRRITKEDWSLGYIPVLGSEEICIGGQRLRLISAPGHTDGHLAMLHVTTNSLIVGDHCVGQGSALLDITSGGNMSDYFSTMYKFMELAPHVLIPMHGRVNMWPKHMLCGYLKNRRNRESTILKAIEKGAKTLYDIVAHTYADVDRSLWIHAASNVRLHVDHLAQQNKLPKEFSMQRFQSSCKLNFLSRWIWEYLHTNLYERYHHRLHIVKVLGAAGVTVVAILYSVGQMLSSRQTYS